MVPVDTKVEQRAFPAGVLTVDSQPKWRRYSHLSLIPPGQPNGGPDLNTHAFWHKERTCHCMFISCPNNITWNQCPSFPCFHVLGVSLAILSFRLGFTKTGKKRKQILLRGVWMIKDPLTATSLRFKAIICYYIFHLYRKTPEPSPNLSPRLWASTYFLNWMGSRSTPLEWVSLFIAALKNRRFHQISIDSSRLLLHCLTKP